MVVLRNSGIARGSRAFWLHVVKTVLTRRH